VCFVGKLYWYSENFCIVVQRTRQKMLFMDICINVKTKMLNLNLKPESYTNFTLNYIDVTLRQKKYLILI